MQPEDDDLRDLRPLEHELRERGRLRLRHRDAAGGRVVLGPALREVAVGDDVARPVLGPLAVAVAIEPLGADLVDAVLALHRVGGPHQARLARILDPGAGRVLPAHLRDDAVLVEVLGPVLVDRAVAVVVDRAEVAAHFALRAADRIEEALRAVGVRARDQVDDVVVEQLRHRRFVAVAVGQPLQRLEHHLGADEVLAVEAGDDQQRRQPRPLRVVDRAELDVAELAAGERAAVRAGAREVLVRARDVLQRALHRGRVVPRGRVVFRRRRCRRCRRRLLRRRAREPDDERHGRHRRPLPPAPPHRRLLRLPDREARHDTGRSVAAREAASTRRSSGQFP